MGSVIGRAPSEAVGALREFGADVGIAFQIVDDILDLTGESATIGKPAAHDLREGTITLPIIHFLAGADADSRATIADIVQGRADDAVTEAMVESIRDSGAIERAYSDAEARVDSALERLAVVDDPQSREALEQFARLALNRSL